MLPSKLRVEDLNVNSVRDIPIYFGIAVSIKWKWLSMYFKASLMGILVKRDTKSNKISLMYYQTLKFEVVVRGFNKDDIKKLDCKLGSP